MKQIIRQLRYGIVPILIAAVWLLCGCGIRTQDTPAVSAMPENTAVLFSSLAEIWLDAGGEIAITVGETVERGFAPEGTPLVDEGAGKTINLELLLSLEPDLVIASPDIPAQAEAAEILEDAGIPTLLCRVESFSDYLTALEAMTAITGNADAVSAGQAMQTEIHSILQAESADGTPEILFIRAGSTASSTKAKLAEDHFACAMLEELGCHNIAADAPILLDGLSMEEILLSDPDYIFFSLMGNAESALANVQTLLEGETWGQLTAVREGRVVILPRELFHFKPCSRWVEAYRYLADILSGEGAV
ncbi:MAG: ABC transporter substrate-binding protein [Clostridia bacterium]|nr:ABC transporter substrate-binding protein [Clostridia bacterium]